MSIIRTSMLAGNWQPGQGSGNDNRAALSLRALSLIGALLLAGGFPGPANAEDFRFGHAAGEAYRVISTVDEDVYINRQWSHAARIINRIAVKVKQVRADGAALLEGEFSTSMKYSGGLAYVADRMYRSEYWLGPLGHYDIGTQYYMPTVRHVPTFPGKDIKPGDTWNAPGEERHDFRDDFGIAEPYIIPIDVQYTFRGPGAYDGKPVDIIEARYTVFHQPGRPTSWVAAYPMQIAGYSRQTLYWDSGSGRLAGYSEQFRFVFDLSDGRTVEYRGIAGSKVIEAEAMDREELAREVRDAVAGIDDIRVETTEGGVTITMENIQFEADSSVLRPEELEKIAAIAGVLSTIPDRDILVGGHTALAGTPQARKELSVQRARAVADELIRLGARRAESVTVIGYGAEKPLASNATESGMARNRRVEITILEN